jgi:hypothetical protein
MGVIHVFRFDLKEDHLGLLLLATVALITVLAVLKMAFPPMSLTDSAFNFFAMLFQPVGALASFLMGLGLPDFLADLLAVPMFWVALAILILWLRARHRGQKGPKVIVVQEYRHRW